MKFLGDYAWTGIFAAVFGFSFLAMVPATSQDLNLKFEDFDKDDDGFIERWEFEDVFTANYWSDWNTKDDPGHLDDEDFYTFNYALIDTDGDELLDEEEWLYGYNYYYGDYVVDDFMVYDIDNDGYIEYAEYYDALYDTDYYAYWDVDNDTYLSEEELAEAVFYNWDLNDNRLMSRSEYRNFDLYYSDI